MIYLVTGGAGFIGTNFIYFMFEKYGNKIQIINVDSLTYAGNQSNLDQLDSKLLSDQHYIFKRTDICDRIEMENLIKTYRPDYIINFAAESHVDRSIKTPQLFLQTNILGTQVLLDLAVKYGIRRFHQVSTDEVYGSLGKKGYFTEKTPLSPRSPYSASKASADLICKAYEETFNLPITISRCSNNYGPYQYQEKLIPLVIHRLLIGKEIPIYGDGLNVRDWLFVEDHCTAIDLILHQSQDGEVYNVGGSNEWTNLNLVKHIIKYVDERLPTSDKRRGNIGEHLISYVTDRMGHDRRYAIDSTKISEELGWKPMTKFNDGIERTIDWYLGQYDFKNEN